MKQENKSILIKYGVCLGIAILLTVGVFWIKGFFTDSASVNIQILSDGFTVSGLMFLLFAGMMFISGEGGLIGIRFVLRNVFLAFIPGGRAKHEVYRDYRERILSEQKKSSNSCILVTGLVFFGIGIIFTAIWYVKYYNLPL